MAHNTGVNDIRANFLAYFKRHGHEVVPSSPLVPHNDPSLMFVNAGMVPFKNVFTGAETRHHKTATSSQKCVRAGGKHNDLDNVGYTARHHTFFEMLGNFSFGDYFKEQAIALAWDLLTKDFALDAERLLITVYAEDEEAAKIWRKVSGFSDDKIIRIGTSDNFWSMGDVGPCGPCSEIFYDHGPEIPGGPPGSPDEDGDRFVEIWNLVFMQYDQREDGPRADLPKPSIDTGMGLERIAAVLQGTHDNYDIDLFRHLIEASVDLTAKPAEGEAKASHRVIADHLRSSSFLIADGVLPSNEGRGYVLRRIMRRAMRHAHILGAEEPLLYRLVPALNAEMGRAYPELERGEALITETLKLEETRFRETLDRGLKLLDEAVGGIGEGGTLPGEVAFKLYDTYGFPVDLTADALKAKGIGIDAEGYEAAMERQRAEARKSWAGSGEAATETLWFELKEKTGATEFLGYDSENASGEIVALVKDGTSVDSLNAGDRGAVILNQTPFYAESGGQVGDHGVIAADGTLFEVEDTKKKLGSLFVHEGALKKGSLKLGDTVELEVDHDWRRGARSHHSATHLLHEALREVLGTHVAQKGSLVQPGRLRFDFSHPKPMTHDQIMQVEALANRMILQNSAVETHLMTPDEAIEKGALALFGEKYGDEVRVVSMGTSPDSSKAGNAYSIELCGGTHVGRTGEIGILKVVAETAVASGVRRIEALTGEAARDYLTAQDDKVREAAELLKVGPDDLLTRLAALVDERRKLERQLGEAKKELALSGGGDGASGGDAVQDIGGLKFLGRTAKGVPAKELRGLVDEAKKRLGSGVVAIIGISEEGKASLVVGVTDDLTASANAVDLAKLGASILGGKGGGGRPDMAQAGGTDGSKADDALAAIAAELQAASAGVAKEAI
ncbi:alanine--tRNA ligase [Methyloligella sp. 2.7D]|uniref:alanine--tRNA ligase n=1 Tax=unclassified Methyloligella TaxID=2625955 RepID=UPI00157DEC57|nr:alanine--tRNA ligase [Methyloligella sp. GL2]QKP77858.1 alanine--tRNA ligase [Methyloligella sp. GL2]